MSNVELRLEHTTQSNGGDLPPHVTRDRDNIKPGMRVVPILITLGTVAAAVLLAWATWQVYMGAPWTRDGTVRAYVVTMAPEVAGRIVKLPVADNQFVHKGDVLFEIEPADYRIALEQAQAQAQRDGAALDYARENENRKATLAQEGWATRDIYHQTTSTLHQSEGVVAFDKAPAAEAQVHLSRTVLHPPVNV